MSIGAGPQASNFPFGFAQGALIRGIPIQPTTPGKVFWVYNGTSLAPQGRGGSDGNPGTFESPYATINFALSQCVAGRGDVVYVKPGHAETISTATGLTFLIAGVQLIGLGNGASRPTISFSTAIGATIAVAAAGCSMINFNIDGTGFANLTAAVSVAAADFALVGNTLTLAGVSNQAVVGVGTTAAAVGLVIDSNIFLATAAAGTNSAVRMVGGSNIAITNNWMEGAFSASLGAINNATTAVSDLLIKGNYIQNGTPNSTKAIVAAAGTTGMIAENYLQILSGTAPITAAGMSWVGGNYYAATVATAGTLI